MSSGFLLSSCDAAKGMADRVATEQLFGHERARARAQPGPGMGGRTDLVETRDRRPVTRQARAWPPDEVLIERAGAGVDVASRPVHVRGLQVGRREGHALQYGRVEVADLSCESYLNAVGVGLAQLLRPRSVPDVELPGSVALDE